ncbi:ABC transporter substrate-binding protein [Streptomyces sp. NPDC058694]|uniref:ABC transporter substrate-binding protein n=1 Tax=Streptomyces sp. NPDC058694 TaxID=3346603 RepID=UPI003654D70B
MRRATRPAFAALTMATTVTTLAALSACTSTDSGSGATGGKKDTLTLGMSADIQGWDPSNQPGYQGWTGEAVYQSLIQCDALGKPQPDAAESWTFKKDNTGVTFQLRSGMKFSDGTPVDSAAVKASIAYIGQHGGQAARFASMRVDTPDSRTVVIAVPKPNPTLVGRMCEAKLASPKFLASGQVNKAPVGSGPYTLDQSATTSGSVYTFAKNDAYWNAKAYPYKKLVIKKITSETAVLNALKTGQLDGSLITQATYNEAEASGLKVVKLRGNTTRLLLTDHQGKKIPALGNVNVRRAMNMVFDKEAMAKDLYRGLASPAVQIFRPGSSAYIKDLKDPYPYNVEKAKDLMAKAGYAKGFTVEIPFMQGQNLEALIPVVKQQLGLLNITVKQVTLSGPNAISELLSGKYPMPLWQLGNYGESLQDIADYVLPDGIWNVMHQPDPTVAKLYDKVLTSSGQESAAAQQEINRYISDQAWFVPMAYPDGFYAHSSKIRVPTMSDSSALNPLLRDFK